VLIVSYIFFLAVFTIGVCWLWPEFVDACEGEPWKVRVALLAILALETASEVAIWHADILRPWTVAVVLFCNFWGGLDACLRYPIMYEIDSFFTLKQAGLLALKLAGYALGFRDMAKHVGWLVLIILCCVFLLPILWITALPWDAGMQHTKHDAVDMDIARRLFRACAYPSERAALMARARVILRRLVVLVARCCPCMRPLVVRWDPSLRRVLSKTSGV